MDHHKRLPSGVGELFADGGSGRTLPVSLPAGSVIWPDPGYPQRLAVERAAFWLTHEPVDGRLWSDLRAEHATSGLWPVLLEDATQPWSAGQIAPEPVTDIANYDAAAFMAEVWSDLSDPAADIEPFGRYSPGPAYPAELREPPADAADRCARLLAGRPLGLVPVSRSADVLTAIGWQGARHHNEWTAPLSAVLRSWEDRFGARLVGLGFNSLELSVAAPPVTWRHALHVAAEHWTFCPEIVIQGTGTLAGHAEQIKGQDTWSFWWE